MSGQKNIQNKNKNDVVKPCSVVLNRGYNNNNCVLYFIIIKI